jgi:transposase
MPGFVPQLRALVASGATLAAASKRLGMSTSAAQRWLTRYPCDRQTKPRISDEQRDQVHELNRLGYSGRAIARLTSIGESSVRRVLLSKPTRYRCRACGGLNLQPQCMTCAARGAIAVI